MANNLVYVFSLTSSMHTTFVTTTERKAKEQTIHHTAVWRSSCQMPLDLVIIMVSEALGAKTDSSDQSLSWFPSHEVAKSTSTPPGRDASPSQVTPQQFVRFPQQFAGTHWYSWVEGGTVRVIKVSCPRTQHNVPRLGLEPGPLDPGTGALTMRPPRLIMSFYEGVC